VIRRNNVASSYAQIAAWAGTQNNGGRGAAQKVLNWAWTDDVRMEDLEPQLQDFVMITHLAEVGRGYHGALEAELYPLLEAIVSGTKAWADYKDFSPSLKYDEDLKTEWS
jgi:hypothetical protein